MWSSHDRSHDLFCSQAKTVTTNITSNNSVILDKCVLSLHIIQFTIVLFIEGNSTSAMTETRQPTNSNGPGWITVPEDVTTSLGRYAVFVCQNQIRSESVIWLINGIENILQSNRGHKAVVMSRNGQSQLQYGPVQANDSGLTFGCEAFTQVGAIPSPLATLTVLSKPLLSD